jgi:hypothetical protein
VFPRARRVNRPWLGLPPLDGWTLAREKAVAVDDGFDEVEEFGAGLLGVGAEHLERSLVVDRVGGHENAFGLLDHRAAGKAPSRLSYSAKRRRTMSSVDCSS